MSLGVVVTVLLLSVAVIAAAVTAALQPRPALAAAPPLRRVTSTLARVEGLRLLRHPAIIAGGLAGLAGFPYGGNEDWQFRWGIQGMYLFALVIPAMVAVHFAVARDARSDTDELAASLPAGMRTRVRAHVMSLGWLLLPVTLLWAVYIAVRFDGELARTMRHVGVTYLWEPSLLELAQGPAAVAVYLLIAIAAGAWWRHPAVGLGLAVLLLYSPLVWMLSLVVDLGVTVPEGGRSALPLEAITTAGQYLFLAGLATFAVGGALVRYGSRRLWAPVAVLGVVAAVAGAVLRSHPGV